MIKVVIKVDESTEKITSIEVKGHAGSAEYGKDLVCAAVSAVITGGMNSLSGKNYQFILNEGHALIGCDNLPNEFDSVVLKTIETQLKTIEETNKQFVEIKIL